jgi:hypothetical protein
MRGARTPSVRARKYEAMERKIQSRKVATTRIQKPA